ncbi:MAG: hypothetical protein ACRDK3_01045 [Actinomycetota bacterium]
MAGTHPTSLPQREVIAFAPPPLRFHSSVLSRIRQEKCIDFESACERRIAGGVHLRWGDQWNHRSADRFVGVRSVGLGEVHGPIMPTALSVVLGRD